MVKTSKWLGRGNGRVKGLVSPWDLFTHNLAIKDERKEVESELFLCTLVVAKLITSNVSSELELFEFVEYF